MFKAVSEGIRQGTIVSAYVGEEGGALAALFKMSFGNRLALPSRAVRSFCNCSRD